MKSHNAHTHSTNLTIPLLPCIYIHSAGWSGRRDSTRQRSPMITSTQTWESHRTQPRQAPHSVAHTDGVSSHRTVSQLSYCHLGLSRPPHGPGNSTQLSWIQCGKGRGQSTSGFPYQHSCLCDCHVVFHNACGLNFSKLTGCTLMLTVLKNWCYILKPVCTVIVTFMFGEQMEFAQFR